MMLMNYLHRNNWCRISAASTAPESLTANIDTRVITAVFPDR